MSPTDAPRTDVLDGFTAQTLRLAPDDEGEVVATLVRSVAPPPTDWAVLYVHGFVDYFFQQELARFWQEQGFAFYALDLRKSGRSIRGHQTPYYVHDVRDYFEEIDEAVRLIRERDGMTTLLLNGHSTGGLTTSLWAHVRRHDGLIDGLLLNSPFFDLNLSLLTRTVAVDAITAMARFRPYAVVPVTGTGLYSESLHHTGRGEWDYDLSWKPADAVPIRAGWLAAVRRAHRRVHEGLDIRCPVLVMASTSSLLPKIWADEIQRVDAVLDVGQIARWSTGLGRHVTTVRIEGGLHDLVLSAEPVRLRVYSEMARWTTAYVATPLGAAGPRDDFGAPA